LFCWFSFIMIIDPCKSIWFLQLPSFTGYTTIPGETSLFSPRSIAFTRFLTGRTKQNQASVVGTNRLVLVICGPWNPAHSVNGEGLTPKKSHYVWNPIHGCGVTMGPM
jgi:hypothetical protein